jgi:hypothetical protein
MLFNFGDFATSAPQSWRPGREFVDIVENGMEMENGAVHFPAAVIDALRKYRAAQRK